MTAIKLCKDCKYFEQTPNSVAFCRVIAPCLFDYVYGKTTPHTTTNNPCNMFRKSNDATACGHDARYFEPKEKENG